MEQVQLTLPTAETQRQFNLGFTQIFLNASIACIIYTRRLISRQSKCFLARNVAQLRVPEGSNHPKDASEVHACFCSEHWVPRADHNDSQEFKVMQLGLHRCADSILDILVGLEHTDVSYS